MTGVIYLFWQNSLNTPVTENTVMPTEEVTTSENTPDTDSDISEEVTSEAIEETTETNIALEPTGEATPTEEETAAE